MKTFLSVVVLIGLGYWLAVRFSGSKPPGQVIKEEVQAAVTGTVSNVVERLEPEKLKEGLAETGEALREKAAEFGKTVAAGTEDARITATVKARLAQKNASYALNIAVSTTDGHVTLAGHVKTQHEVHACVHDAMAVEGVREVVSTLRVRP
jgi:osmotically-inducible protein OsmY